jgi:hypothetical protein
MVELESEWGVNTGSDEGMETQIIDDVLQRVADICDDNALGNSQGRYMSYRLFAGVTGRYLRDPLPEHIVATIRNEFPDDTYTGYQD